MSLLTRRSIDEAAIDTLEVNLDDVGASVRAGVPRDKLLAVGDGNEAGALHAITVVDPAVGAVRGEGIRGEEGQSAAQAGVLGVIEGAVHVPA